MPGVLKIKVNSSERRLILLFCVGSSKKKEVNLLANEVLYEINTWYFVIGRPLPLLRCFLSLFPFWPISKCNHYHQVTPGVCLQRSTWHAGAVYPSSRGKHARQNAVSLPAWNQRSRTALPQLFWKRERKKKKNTRGDRRRLFSPTLSTALYALRLPDCRETPRRLSIMETVTTFSPLRMASRTLPRRREGLGRIKKKTNLHIQHVLPAGSVIAGGRT